MLPLRLKLDDLAGKEKISYHDNEAPEFPGINRVGSLDGDLDALARQDGEFEATVDSSG